LGNPCDSQKTGGVTLGYALVPAIEKAEQAGVCLATVRRSNHFGIAGYLVVMATRRGLGGMAMTDSSPLLLDMATSTVAYGKLEVARWAHTPIPLGWAVDNRGLPTTIPYAARFLTPLDGAPGALSFPARGPNRPAGIGHPLMAWRIDAFRASEEFSAPSGR
jgi:LDH2 family malate/lactate/ureidoglycolate dehydrogenase